MLPKVWQAPPSPGLQVPLPTELRRPFLVPPPRKLAAPPRAPALPQAIELPLQPDASQIQRWLSTYFATCTEGMIAVAWRDAATGKITNERRFARDDPGIGAFVAAMNAVPGQNAYFVAATVVSDAEAPRERGRSADIHFCQAPGLWSDQDSPEHVAQADGVAMPLRPQIVVTTGTVPARRTQRYMLLSEPLRDPHTVSELNKRFHLLLSGDSTVTNPTRLMRLPGTIAWPFKGGKPLPGRIPELTAFVQDHTASPYTVSFLKENLPRLDSAPHVGSGVPAITPPGGKATVAELRARLSRSEEGRHDALVRLTAHYVGTNLSDEEILALTAGYGSVPDHRGDIQNEEEWAETVLRRVESARKKWSVPNTDRAATSAAEEGAAAFALFPLPQASGTSAQAGSSVLRKRLKDRMLSPGECSLARGEGIVEGLLSPGDVAALVAPPGAGKSVLAPYIGYQVASGNPIFGRHVKQGRVLYVCAEDFNGMQQRVMALRDRIGDAPDFRLVDTDSLANPSSQDELLEAVREWCPTLVVLDTLNAAFSVRNENSSEDMGQIVGFLRCMASEGCAVLIIHHPAKDGGGTPRGHSSLHATLDVCFTLDQRDADGLTVCRVSKNRSGDDRLRAAFRIASVVMGYSERGTKITAPIAEEVASAGSPQRPPLSDSLKAMVRILGEMQSTSPEGVTVAEFVAECERRQVSMAKDVESRMKVIKKAYRKLVADGHISQAGAVIRVANAGSFSPLVGIDGSAWAKSQKTAGTQENQQEPLGTDVGTDSRNLEPLEPHPLGWSAPVLPNGASDSSTTACIAVPPAAVGHYAQTTPPRTQAGGEAMATSTSLRPQVHPSREGVARP